MVLILFHINFGRNWMRNWKTKKFLIKFNHTGDRSYVTAILSYSQFSKLIILSVQLELADCCKFVVKLLSTPPGNVERTTRFLDFVRYLCSEKIYMEF
jgi:hypothetical protein